MGSGLAKNLIGAGFETFGLDLDPDRMAAFTDMGGIAGATPAEIGRNCDAVFVMVMSGDQVRAVLFGEEGLLVCMAEEARSFSRQPSSRQKPAPSEPKWPTQAFT